MLKKKKSKKIKSTTTTTTPVITTYTSNRSHFTKLSYVHLLFPKGHLSYMRYTITAMTLYMPLKCSTWTHHNHMSEASFRPSVENIEEIPQQFRHADTVSYVAVLFCRQGKKKCNSAEIVRLPCVLYQSVFRVFLRGLFINFLRQ